MRLGVPLKASLAAVLALLKALTGLGMPLKASLVVLRD
jgi:hypothetical protein